MELCHTRVDGGILSLSNTSTCLDRKVSVCKSSHVASNDALCMQYGVHSYVLNNGAWGQINLIRLPKHRGLILSVRGFVRITVPTAQNYHGYR